MRKWLICLCVVGMISGGCSDDDNSSNQDMGYIDLNVNSDSAQQNTDSAIEEDSSTQADASVGNQGHEEDGDYSWDSSKVTEIHLNGDSISVDGSGASVDGTTVTIESAGAYLVDGTLNDGQLVVDTEDKEKVQIILDDVTMTNSTSSPFFISNAEKTIVILKSGTTNTLNDAQTYIYPNPEEDEPNAALFSKDNLSISGEGSLVINANYGDGIKSKDGLVIDSGTIKITSVDDGMIGKDYLYIKNGTIDIQASGDGIKSTEDSDPALGYMVISGGTFTIKAAGDGVQAETDLTVSGGSFDIETGGGSGAYLASDASAKALKSATQTVIDGGSFVISAADDGVHSNGNITINKGSFTIATGDDGVHADAELTINGGDINVTESYEGIESAVITINDGTVRVISSDDGVNVAGGADGSGQQHPPHQPPGGGDDFNYDGDYYLYINGGYIVVNADGDGIDANGAIEMTDGKVLVDGPSADNNGALDFDGYFKIFGGYLLATGSSRMAQMPGTASTQNSVLASFNTKSANTLVHLQDSNQSELFTFQPTKSYASVVFSAPSLVNGSYSLYTGGTSTGTNTDGLYTGGTYSGGTKVRDFTVSSVTTKVN